MAENVCKNLSLEGDLRPRNVKDYPKCGEDIVIFHAAGSDPHISF
jgi:hypothetical protein